MCRPEVSAATVLVAILAMGCGGDDVKQRPRADVAAEPTTDGAAIDQASAPLDGTPGGLDVRLADTAPPSDTVASPDVAAADTAASPDVPRDTTASPDVARDTAAGIDVTRDTAPPVAACAPPTRIDQPIAKLSATGCVDPADPRKLAAVVVPYELNSPLWSDGAVKTRGMVIPAGRKIHVKDCATEPAMCPSGSADTGKFVFPVGTVMVKNFLFDDKFVETRLFVRFDAATWVGYSYQWNEAQTDATIVPDDRIDVSFNTGARTVEWTYPSRIDCMRCHVASGGSTLGPETAQLNRVVGGMNQLDRWQAQGLFDAPIARPYQAALVAPYAAEGGMPPAGASIEERARSYLHANCAFCHRPDAMFPHFDLRYGVGFKDTKVCNAAPMKGDVGVPGSLLFKPANASESVLWLRMNALPLLGRMPPVASKVIDQQAVKLIGDWIASVAACPP